jgi:MEDS: MEthanogen/methylotroph, DcmR Sensory domain
VVHQRRGAPTGLLGTEDLMEYETRVNYVIPRHEDTVARTYDLTKFGASAAMDALRTHPVGIIGGLLEENSFYVSPDQLLSEIRERRSAGQSAVLNQAGSPGRLMKPCRHG